MKKIILSSIAFFRVAKNWNELEYEDRDCSIFFNVRNTNLLDDELMVILLGIKRFFHIANS